MSELNNPIRVSIRTRTVNIHDLLGDTRRITDLEINPSEGNIYVHWTEREHRLAGAEPTTQPTTNNDDAENE